MARQTENKELDPQFLERWSPRSFLSDPLNDKQINTLFEAARWSPSCFNEQPWLFAYARGQSLNKFQAVLTAKNQQWASSAPLLVLVFSRKEFSHNNQPNAWAEFDTGAAWMSLALQAHKMGLACHAMGGFDKDKAFVAAKVDSEKFNAICAIAVGKRGPLETLDPAFHEKEAPSDRNPLADMIQEVKD